MRRKWIIIIIALFGGLVGGIVLSEIIGIIGWLLTGEAVGIKYLPIMLAVLCAGVAVIIASKKR